MESENTTDPYEDNRDVARSRQSHRSSKRHSRESSRQKHKDKILDEDKKNVNVSIESRSKTRTWHSDPDRDQVSDGEGRRSGRSFYSEDYENASTSEGSISPYSQSRTPSPSPHRGMRARRFTNSSHYKTGGAGRLGVSRPQRPGGLPLSQRRGVRSQSKESTPAKDLDLVTKRMLSARLLKINELRNSLAELQQRMDELQKENRVLRQLQARQEKALQRYDDTESEISQLLSRHNNETHVLRERLRRTQERERAAERRLKDSEEQLQRSRASVTRLKRLVEQRELGERDELSRRLDEEKARAQEAERRVKELERSLELSNNSYQRQLAAEKKKTISAQEAIGSLQDELERLTNKLKEKEKELDAKNIYANRMMKPTPRKDTDSGAKRKVPSRSSTKAVSIKDRTSSPDFPSPPPGISDANDYSEQVPDEYLSLKELDSVDRQAEAEDGHQKREPHRVRERDKEKDKELVKEEEEEKEEAPQEVNVLEESPKRLRDGLEKEEEEENRQSSFLNQEEEKASRIHVQEEVKKWNQDALASQQAAEESRRKKEQLLAKMREIDRQNRGAQDSMFAEAGPSEPSKGPSNHSSPRLPEQRNHVNSSIFNLTETDESASFRAGSREGGRRRSGAEGGVASTVMGRRGLRPQISNDDLAFGSYAPSFGNSSSRGSAGFPPPPPPMEDRDSALEAIGVFSLRGVEPGKEKELERGVAKDKKSVLMQQLFGSAVGDAGNAPYKMEVLNSPPSTNGVRSRREGLLSYGLGSPPASSLNTFQIADNKPAIRAIASFDDDIEELTL